MEILDFPDTFKNFGKYNVQKCRFTPVTVFTYGVLENFLMGDIDQFIEDLEKLQTYILTATGYGWGNPHWRMSNIYGDEFSFSIYKEKVGHSFHLWNISGGTAVHSCIFPEDISERLKIFAHMVLVSEKFTKGIMECSGCGTDIPIHGGVAGRYFAGSYCQNCWDTKYKAIEAKETYN